MFRLVQLPAVNGSEDAIMAVDEPRSSNLPFPTISILSNLAKCIEYFSSFLNAFLSTKKTVPSVIEEMKKIDRVAKPDFKIFIGEALAGHVLVEQVKSFDAAVGVDGIILTKLDCDAKGGNSISIAHDAAKPIMFFGVGQEYGDLVPFDPGYIAAKVLEA